MAAPCAVVLICVLTCSGDAAVATISPADQPDGSTEVAAEQRWVWPVAPFRLESPYSAPAHRYGAGHRGIDMRPMAAIEVRAPAEGVIAFNGMVAERGVLTIDHGDGLVTTLEPIVSSLDAGTAVSRGEPVGEVGLGGHTNAGALHFGVRLDGEYINPLLLLGGVPRAVLLPCC